jgi:hypothetical protein
MTSDVEFKYSRADVDSSSQVLPSFPCFTFITICCKACLGTITHSLTMKEPASISRNRQCRIPDTLQAVFLASNRGKEVHQSPPDQSAAKVFQRNWIYQKKSNSAKNEKEGSKKNLWRFTRSKSFRNTDNQDKAVPVVVTAPSTSQVSFP